MAHKINRRKAIRILGGSLGVTAGYTMTVSANNGARVEGIAYNPKSHEILGEASGQFNQQHDELVGNLRIDGRQFNLSQNHPFEERRIESGVYQTYRSLNKRNDEEYNELVHLTKSNESNMTGFVRTPESLDRIGFVLADNNSTYDNLIDFVLMKQGDK